MINPITDIESKYKWNVDIERGITNVKHRFDSQDYFHSFPGKYRKLYLYDRRYKTKKIRKITIS